MPTEQGANSRNGYGRKTVYGVEEHAVLALSEDGIECLRDLLGEHKRDYK